MAHEDDLHGQSLFEAPPMAEQERMIEAVLFASAEPVSLKELEARMPHGCDAGEAMVHLRKRYEGRGVQVVKVGDAYAMRTAADLGFLMQKETVEVRKLSRAAIETLAIIAYHLCGHGKLSGSFRSGKCARSAGPQRVARGWLAGKSSTAGQCAVDGRW